MTNLIWQAYDTLLADLDGVVYEGKNAIEPAPQVLNTLQSQGVKVGYVTNNSSRTPEEIAEQLEGFGVATSPGQVIGSAEIATQMLMEAVPAGSKIMVVGGDGLRSAVTGAGFELVNNSDDKPAAVIQGFAPDVAWHHLAEASYAIQRGAKWIATNQDWTIPREKGMAPGNGTLVSAIHTAVGILPPVAGKPEPEIFHASVRKLGATKALFVGDRIDTDISGSNRAGIDSAVVMTGVATRKELLGLKPGNRPTYILGDMGELLKPYQSPVATKRGYKCGKVLVELLGNKVRVIDGDPKSLSALKAACAVIWGAELPIYALDVEPELYL